MLIAIAFIFAIKKAKIALNLLDKQVLIASIIAKNIAAIANLHIKI